MLTERWQTMVSAAGEEAQGASAAGSQPTAALIDDLSPVRFAGVDVLNFLQGYLTIDLDRLTAQTPLFAALTNLKGRVVATGWCQLHSTEQVDWLVQRDLAPVVREFMTRYLAFSKTELVGTDTECLTIGIVDHLGNPSARLISSEEELDQLAATHQVSRPEHWRIACIKHGFTVIDSRTSGSYLPQMIGLVEAGAVDFDKGCYLGQEVVARAQHRGEVKRRLICLRGLEQHVESGSSLKDADGREAGSVLAGEPPLCLAVVRQPAAASYQIDQQRLIPDAG